MFVSLKVQDARTICVSLQYSGDVLVYVIQCVSACLDFKIPIKYKFASTSFNSRLPHGESSAVGLLRLISAGAY